MAESFRYNAIFLFRGEFTPGNASYLLDEASCFLSVIYNSENVWVLILHPEMGFILKAFNLFYCGFSWIKPLDCTGSSHIIYCLEYTP